MSISTEPRPPKRQKSQKNDTNQDPLSRLPNHIVAEILTLLPPRDAFATRRLCKSWYSAWSSDPILAFAENDTVVPLRKRHHHTHDDLIAFADQTFQNLSTTKLIRTLKLRLRMYGQNSLSHITSWLQFIKNRHIQTLHIDAVTNHIHFSLPLSILSTNSLTTLNLSNLEIRISNNHPSISLPSLTSLSLNHTTLDDETARRLLAAAPRLEKLKVIFCLGPKELEILNPRLRVLEVRQFSLPVRVAMGEAERLESVDFVGRGWRESGIGAAAGLRALRLQVLEMRDLREFEACVGGMVGLERLRVGWRRGGEREMRVSGKSLKEVVVDGVLQRVEVFVDAPNLERFECNQRFVTVKGLSSSAKLVELGVKVS